MNKTFSLRFLITVVAFFTAAAVAITTMLFMYVIIPRREGVLFQYNQKMLEINKLVQAFYIGEIDENYMKDGVSYGYTWGLNDKYAAYVPKEEAEESMNTLYGLNTGMGVQVAWHPDTNNIFVSDVHKDSPADNAGIKPRDQITKLDEYSVKDIGYEKSLAYIKTIPAGDKLTAVILRDGEELTVEVTLTQYVAQSVFYEKIGDNGYIQITAFNDMTVDQFVEAVDDLVAQNVSSLIFDLRGNGGGTLMSVYHMVDYLVPEGLVIKVDYKGDEYDETYLSDKHGINVPMAVLTDENTASASELFTQSLIDFNKAVSIGRNTYGKGVVQRTFTLSDGSLVRFTVAKYYTANGTCLDGIGVAPKVPVEWTDDEMKYRLVIDIEDDKDYKAAVNYLNGQLS